MGIYETRQKFLSLVKDARYSYGDEAVTRQETIRRAAKFVKDVLLIDVDPEKATCDSMRDVRFTELPPLVFTKIYEDWCVGLNVDRTKPGFREWWKSPFNRDYSHLRPRSIYAESLRDLVQALGDNGDDPGEIMIFPDVEEFLTYQVVNLDTLNNETAFWFDGHIYAVLPGYWRDGDGVGVLVRGVKARDLIRYAQTVPGWG